MKKIQNYNRIYHIRSIIKSNRSHWFWGRSQVFLLENDCLVNQERRTERGKKLYPGDKVVILNDEYVIVNDQKNKS